MAEFAKAQECVIKVGVNELKPHLSPKLEGGGPLGQSFSKAMSKIGCDTEFYWMPWARSLRMVKSGKITVTFPRVGTIEREKDFVLSKPIWKDELHLYHLSDKNIKLTSVEELTKYNVAGVQGYNYFPKNMENLMHIKKVSNENVLVNVLLKKRVDAILVWDALLYNSPELLDNPNIKKHSYVLNTQKGLALFTKHDPNSKRYAEAFDLQFSKYLKEFHQ